MPITWGFHPVITKDYEAGSWSCAQAELSHWGSTFRGTLSRGSKTRNPFTM